jgi:hypothetical protein
MLGQANLTVVQAALTAAAEPGAPIGSTAIKMTATLLSFLDSATMDDIISIIIYPQYYSLQLVLQELHRLLPSWNVLTRDHYRINLLPPDEYRKALRTMKKTFNHL